MAAFDSPGFDDHVKLILAPGGDLESSLPRQLADGIEWTDAPHRESRDYTPRAVDLEEGWMDLDFVLHGDGPAAAWAIAARPGDTLAMVGPKSSLVLPAESTGILLVGDETALPAIGRFFDDRPLDVPAHALIALGDASGRQELALRPGDSASFVEIDPTDGDALLAAVHARLEEIGGLDAALGQDPFVWAAGESRALLPLRRWAGRERGLERSRLGISGYWHVGADDTPPGSEGGRQSTPDSPAAWFAISSALEIGLLDLLREGSRTVTGCASALGANASGLDVLGNVLEAHGILERSHPSGDRGGSALSLTRAGREVVDDEHVREHYEGLEAARLRALVELPGALRSGRAPWRRHYGSSLAQDLQERPAWAGEAAEHAESLRFLQHGLLRVLESLDAVVAGGEVLLSGPGAAVIDDILGQRTLMPDAPSARVVRSDRDCGLLPGVTAATEVSTAARPGALPSASVSVMTLQLLEDDDAIRHLRALAREGSQALVIAPARPDELAGHSAERMLLAFVDTGCGPRDAQRVEELARIAGWGTCTEHDLGWGVCAYLLSAPHADGVREVAASADHAR
nr:siderophore-interacting protein [Brachybacterium halotolerans]